MKKILFKKLGITAFATTIFFYLPFSVLICLVLWPALLISLFARVVKKDERAKMDSLMVLTYAFTLLILFSFAPQGSRKQMVDTRDWDEKSLSEVLQSLGEQTNTGINLSWYEVNGENPDKVMDFENTKKMKLSECLEMLSEQTGYDVYTNMKSLSLSGFYQGRSTIIFQPYCNENHDYNPLKEVVWFFYHLINGTPGFG